MVLVDSFQVQIFQITSLSTADVSGISQFPAGTSLNSASSTFDWGYIKAVAVTGLLQEPMLQSQMLLQMMGISPSCCAVSDFLVQCTQWEIQYKLYSRLWAVNTQGLTQLTRLSRIDQVCSIHYLWGINDWLNQQLDPWNVIQESLGFWIPGTGFRMSVAVRLLQIPIISRIPDSTSRITNSKSQDFAFHKQIVSPIPVSWLRYMEETTAISKQTKTIPF